MPRKCPRLGHKGNGFHEGAAICECAVESLRRYTYLGSEDEDDQGSFGQRFLCFSLPADLGMCNIKSETTLLAAKEFEMKG
jgi:hypothetical protein